LDPSIEPQDGLNMQLNLAPAIDQDQGMARGSEFFEIGISLADGPGNDVKWGLITATWRYRADREERL
jgi:hypothetical protein